MKICTKCKIEKSFSDFAKAKNRKSGYQPICKKCNKIYRQENSEKIKLLNKNYYESNREVILEQKKEYYSENREDILSKKMEYHEQNRERILEYRHKYVEENPEKIKQWFASNRNKIAKNAANRRARKLNATPDWLSDEQKCEIDVIYFLCKIISEDTGIEHHVDHIIPLKGKTVCGLHVPWNLRIIPAKENIEKSNKLSDVDCSVLPTDC